MKGFFMKKYLTALFILCSTQSFALENCVDFPVRDNQEQNYKGEITEVSDITSYAGCPASVLVNKENVSPLVKVVDRDEEKRCVYQYRGVHFMCQM